MDAAFKSYPEIWTTQFDFHNKPGERAQPTGMTALEVSTERRLHFSHDQLSVGGATCPFHPDALYVAFDAPAALGCHLVLGWPMPRHILDLQAEFRRLTSGRDVEGEDLPSALRHFALGGDGVDAISRLLTAMSDTLDLPRALLRGRYTAAVARMEDTGVPIDMEYFTRLRDGWQRLQDALIAEMDQDYGVYQGRKFNSRLWRAWVNKNRIRWPKYKSGELNLKLDTFRDIAAAHPEVLQMKELRASLSVLRQFGLAVGQDGRSRCRLRPFASKTGRNQPSTSQFIFCPAVWLRGLIKPAEGRALAYVDYEQQEFGIGAVLSGDQHMMDAYRAGDPYLEFAKQAQAVPQDATKASHKDERERFKQCALGVQYGMMAWSLSKRLGVSIDDARKLLDIHKKTYSTYWRWSDEVGRRALEDGELRAAFGWTVHTNSKSNPRSVRNFPLQANGAEMLRLACIDLMERGVSVCAPVHDALLIEAPVDGIEDAVTVCKESMRRASEAVLNGFSLRTDVKVIRFPDRYMDGRGRRMWDAVMKLLDGVAISPGVGGVTAARQEGPSGRYTRGLYSGPLPHDQQGLGVAEKGPSILLDDLGLADLRVPQVVCPDKPAQKRASSSCSVQKSSPSQKSASYRWVEKGKFILGPIPVAWFRQAARLPGKNVLLVSLALWHLDGMDIGREGLKLTSQVLAHFGVENRQAKYTSLAALKRAGLIQVRSQHGKNPVVTLMREAGANEVEASSRRRGCSSARASA